MLAVSASVSARVSEEVHRGRKEEVDEHANLTSLTVGAVSNVFITNRHRSEAGDELR